MAISDREKQIAVILIGSKSSSADADRAVLAVATALSKVKPPSIGKRDERRWADDCVTVLAPIFMHFTGKKIGFTNSEAETRFERFARLAIVTPERRVSRNLIKTAIRRYLVRTSSKMAAE